MIRVYLRVVLFVVVYSYSLPGGFLPAGLFAGGYACIFTAFNVASFWSAHGKVRRITDLTRTATALVRGRGKGEHRTCIRI
jgi:hypothetical protein